MTLLPVLKPVMKYNLSSPLAGSGGGVPTWQPSDLYTGSDDGAFLDGTDKSTMYGVDQITPVVASNDLVGKIVDLSGLGNHFLSTSSPSSPAYGDVAGVKWLAFSGSQWMECLIAKPINYTVIAACRGALGFVCGSRNVGGTVASTWGQIQCDTAWKYNWGIGDGTLYSYGKSTDAAFASGVDVIAEQTYETGQSEPVLRINGSVIANTKTAGTATALGGTSYKFAIGRTGEVAQYYSGRIFGLCVINRVITPAERAAINSYFSARMP